MSRRRIAAVAAALTLGLAAATVAAVPASAAPASATHTSAAKVSYRDAVPGVAPKGADQGAAVYLDAAGHVLAPARPARFGCTPVSGRDNPHRSATEGQVSGHGWWGKGSCSNNTADVLNCLYEYYTDASWRQKACSSVDTLSPGTGGSANRTNARINCGSYANTSWRNHVNVDVRGEIDSNEVPFNAADVTCRVN